MKALIQRVAEAEVIVEHAQVAQISAGLLVLLGVGKNDTEQEARKLLDKVLRYRVFEDAAGKMNQSLLDINGDLLVVSQFTLVAETQKGLRPSFSSAAPPGLARALYECFVAYAKDSGLHVQTGQFGADMKVGLVNDGPVTFMLEV
ncbi:MAG: D-tyrosyl-tRNA(Tyr) deacylase [Oleiphilus sp.]|nr:MAG: D-tyrosyl-tRNA(Tyr) deacylase [Oleiphilus sp.]